MFLPYCMCGGIRIDLLLVLTILMKCQVLFGFFQQLANVWLIHRGESRISGKGVHIYIKGWGLVLLILSHFLKHPMKMK